MQKKFLIPIIISIVAVLSIIFAIVYKQTSKDPFENTEVVETLPPKETDEIITKVDKTETDPSDLDFEVEPPKAVISNENGEILSESEVEALEQAQAEAVKLETKEVNGETVIVDQQGNEVYTNEANPDSEKIVDGQVMEEIQSAVEDYSVQQTKNNTKEFLIVQVKKLQEAGNSDFASITEESIRNATDKELDELYIKVMKAVGTER